jgi:hypothetical protein
VSTVQFRPPAPPSNPRPSRACGHSAASRTSRTILKIPQLCPKLCPRESQRIQAQPTPAKMGAQSQQRIARWRTCLCPQQVIPTRCAGGRHVFTSQVLIQYFRRAILVATLPGFRSSCGRPGETVDTAKETPASHRASSRPYQVHLFLKLQANRKMVCYINVSEKRRITK